MSIASLYKRKGHRNESASCQGRSWRNPMFGNPDVAVLTIRVYPLSCPPRLSPIYLLSCIPLFTLECITTFVSVDAKSSRRGTLTHNIVFYTSYKSESSHRLIRVKYCQSGARGPERNIPFKNSTEQNAFCSLTLSFLLSISSPLSSVPLTMSPSLRFYTIDAFTKLPFAGKARHNPPSSPRVDC